MKRPKFPHLVKEGSNFSKIYRYKWRNRRRRRTYQAFRFSIRLAGSRHTFTRSDFDVARKLAREKLIEAANGETALGGMTERDANMLLRAGAEVWPFEVPLDQVAREWKQANEIVERWNRANPNRPKVRVPDVARYWEDRHRNLDENRTVPEVYTELAAELERRKRSERHKRDLKHRCGGFAEFFTGPISLVKAADIRSFIDSHPKLGPRSRNNFNRALGTLFNFAKKRRYLPAEWDEIDQPITLKHEGVEIYRPDEMSVLLEHANTEERLFLAVAGFAGVRSMEFTRLTWRSFLFTEEQATITIGAKEAKTAARRVIPISSNLWQWIQPHAKLDGALWSWCSEHRQDQVGRAMLKLAKKAGVKWKHNGLRHSFISYRLAQTKNIALVAEESGNSPAIIKTNYDGLAQPGQAKRWFALKPQTVEGYKVADLFEAAASMAAAPLPSETVEKLISVSADRA